jgi:hypothetical protein
VALLRNPKLPRYVAPNFLQYLSASVKGNKPNSNNPTTSYDNKNSPKPIP